ncbi:MAG: tetratricopeptide repeat protein [Nannocystaceae bacterium]
MFRSLRALTFVSAVFLAAACGKKPEGGTATPEEGSIGAAQDAKIKKAKDEAKTATLIEQANADLAKGRYVSARNKANEALAVNPNDAHAYAVLGASHWRAGDFEASMKAYKEALELEKGNFGATIGLARCLQVLGDHKGAIEVIDALPADSIKQLDALLSKLWSYYALADADKSVEMADELFVKLGDDPIKPVIQAHAAFMRPLEGKGELIKIEGERGTSSAGLDVDGGLKYTGAEIGGDFSQIVFFELREEARIHTDLAKKLGLKPVGTYKPLGTDTDANIVLVPEIKIGKLSLKNVPAVVEDLSPFASIGDVPGMLVGRQIMNKLGSYTFDFPNSSFEATAVAPTAPPTGGVEAPFLLIDMHLLLVPVTRISLDGSDFSFFAWLGGRYKAALAVTRRTWLKSGHLPRELDQLDDPDAGLKMVYVEQLKIGDLAIKGLGSLVLAGNPPDPEISQIIDGTSFELGGYINLTMMKQWKLTFIPAAGKLFVTPRK